MILVPVESTYALLISPSL